MGSSIIKVGHAVNNVNGESWDEKGHNQIVQIFISHWDYGINSIQFRYVENGNMVLSNRHSKNDGSKFDVVNLNYPTEYITWISGYKRGSIKSITFGTNRREYGPFGKLNKDGYEKEFKFQVGEGCQFWGFHGTNNCGELEFIGIYLKPNTTLDLTVNKNIVKRNLKSED